MNQEEQEGQEGQEEQEGREEKKDGGGVLKNVHEVGVFWTGRQT